MTWAVFALSLAAMVAALLVWALATGEPLTPDIVLYPAAYVAFGAVGALIVSRHPANLIGRLALLTGVSGSVVALSDSVARSAQPAVGQDWAAWLAAWGFPATLAAPLLLILVFPTGRLASDRWRIVAALIVVGVVGLAIGNAFTPHLADYPSVPNPVGIPAFTGSPLEYGGMAWFPLLGGAIAATAGLVPRLRRAQGIEREQLKWITFAAAVHGLNWIVLAIDLPGTGGEIAKYGIFATLLLIPIATGIAILRYRLYDIDLVIRRTLVYGVVVSILGGAYVALILTLQSMLSSVVGGDMLPVALSTLLIAALFGPVRGRVRDLVDRRFYRSRYDHQRLVEAFGARLRDKVELDSVSQALTGVASQAVSPASITLWLRRGVPLSPHDRS
ncbi:MAG: hypothetical protein ACXWXR_10585 [Candidatus Limnocylindrales bacterium]